MTTEDTVKKVFDYIKNNFTEDSLGPQVIQRFQYKKQVNDIKGVYYDLLYFFYLVSYSYTRERILSDYI